MDYHGLTSLAGQLRRDPLPNLRLGTRVDEQVQLALPEHVDEPGRDHQLAHVDALAARLREIAVSGGSVLAVIEVERVKGVLAGLRG